MTNSKSLGKTLLIVFIVLVILFIIHQLSKFLPISNYLSLITACILVYVPIFILSKRKKKIDFIDIDLKSYLKSLNQSLIFSVLTLGPLLVLSFFVFWASFRIESGWHYLEFFIFQLIMVALPEEFFFRGYLQGQLNLVFERKWSWFGVKVGPALIWSSIIFALSHSVISLQIWHPLIFIPALGFGWLYEKTNSITASVIYHALCNLLAYAILIKF